MYLATLQLGRIGFFTDYGWFYLELLVLLFSIGAGVLWLIEKSRHRGESPIIRPNPMGSIPAHLLKTKGGRIGKTALAVFLGMAMGWIWKGHQDHATYQQEHEAWKQRNANWNQEHAAYQEAVARWKAKQKENR